MAERETPTRVTPRTAPAPVTEPMRRYAPGRECPDQRETAIPFVRDA